MARAFASRSGCRRSNTGNGCARCTGFRFRINPAQGRRQRGPRGAAGHGGHPCAGPGRVPEESSPIVNVHFLLPCPADLAPELPFLGLIGGTAQWLFVRERIASVTISAGSDLVRGTRRGACRKDLARRGESAGNGSRKTLPRYRVVKEKRATMAQTPSQVRRRPATACGYRNLFLAGDWIDTGLPATIESAIRSGESAARAACARSPH